MSHKEKHEFFDNQVDVIKINWLTEINERVEKAHEKFPNTEKRVLSTVISLDYLLNLVASNSVELIKLGDLISDLKDEFDELTSLNRKHTESSGH